MSTRAPGESAAAEGGPPATRRAADVWPESAGLPQNFVSCILQTRDGYIWAGTRAGLARFDGVRFTTYDDLAPGQLRESEVWALAEDADSALWIGTFGGGLTRLRDGVFTTYDVRDGLPSDQITALAVGNDGGLWVGTSAGLARRSGNRFEVPAAARDIPGGRVLALHTDRLGVVWIGSEEGLASYSSGRFVNHTRADPRNLSGFVNAIAGDLERGLWLSMWRSGDPNNGVRVLKDGAVRSLTSADGLVSNTVQALAIDADGTPCIGTLAGLFRYRDGRLERQFAAVTSARSSHARDAVSQRPIHSLYLDREGNLWFGTRSDGLGRLRNTAFSDVRSADDVDVRLLHEDGTGSMWLGTPAGLLQLGSGPPKEYLLPPSLAADALAEGPAGSLLIGTARGLYEWSAGRIRRADLEGTEDLRVSVLLTDGRGTTWIGTRAKGLYRHDATGLRHFTPRDGLLGTEVRGIARDRRGDVWIGTRNGGVSRFRGETFTTFGPAQGLAGKAVQAVFVDADDDVWVATRTGVSRIRGGRAASITAANGLPANYFYQIVEGNDGNLWLAHARGIVRAAKRELNAVADGRAARVQATLLGAESGMQSTSMTVAHQPTALRARDGRLWFATTHGVVVLDPRTTARNTLPPPVRIEEVRAGHEPRAARDGLLIEPAQSELEISYTALSFVVPERVLFRYRLEGFDRHWVDAGSRRTAYYTNLPPGAYSFRVIASNNDGVWNEQGASISFRVLPRWYQRRDVHLLAALGVLLLTSAGYRLRTRQLRARERELTARVAERTHELRELTASLEQRVGERTAELATANEALTAEKERLAVTLKSIGDGVIATDIEANVVLINRVAEQITGWSAADAVGRRLDEVFRTLDRTSRMALADPTLSSRERAVPGGFTAPCILVTRDGRDVLVADSAAPIRDPRSHVIGAVLVFRDVTERDRMEEQLRDAQKLEALGVLAGGIAHDFNNLLTGVFGLVDVARVSSPQPSKARDALDKALSVLEKSRGLTRQLLTFAKAGEPIRRPVRLGDMVREAAGFALSGSDVVADFQCADNLWPCDVDEQQMNQVVDNLVLNARQAMPTGGEVVIRLRNVGLSELEGVPVAPGPHVRLSITDEGPGIPHELRGRVFEPFFTTKPGGTGLGLPMVYSIVRKHGGHVALESEAGKGATFHVYLPACPGTVPGGPAAAPRPMPAGGLARILVMDDEPYIREVARESLEYLGYDVLVAHDDEEAVRVLREARDRGETVDAAILDLTIPGGHGGVAALQLLRAIVPELPGIASSGYSGDPVMARPSQHGFAAALQKPYTIADLGESVAQVLARSVGAGGGGQ